MPVTTQTAEFHTSGSHGRPRGEHCHTNGSQDKFKYITAYTAKAKAVGYIL